MYFVGPINPPSKQNQYIIVCTDYLTKWAETKGHQGLLTHLIEYLLTHHKIKHMTSTPYHAQANGQVEVTNRDLEGILTKVVSSSRKD